MISGRKWPAIDLMTLYTKGGTEQWNKFLARIESENNVLELEKTLYGIQAGMNDLVKDKLNTPKICVWYLRLFKSLEKSAKRIYKKMYPNPIDLNDHSYGMKAIEIKRKRDVAFENFIRRSSF